MYVYYIIQHDETDHILLQKDLWLGNGTAQKFSFSNLNFRFVQIAAVCKHSHSNHHCHYPRNPIKVYTCTVTPCLDPKSQSL